MADDENDDGMESFEIDDRDLEYAINPLARRGLSKNQQLYGIWADREESDEEDEHAGFGFGGNRRKPKNYSAPVSFVSGGVKHGNKIEGESKIDEDDNGAIEIERRSKRTTRRQAGANVFAGMRTSTVHSTVDPEKFADWAKHSKSDVIMKMMKKMGYVPGQGLGVNKQGIVEPIQPILRPGRAAVGAYGKEGKGPKFGESAGDAQRRTEVSSADMKNEELGRRGNWKKAGAKKTVKYQYKTVNEVLAEGGPLRKQLETVNVGIKVIDMTGKEQKVYSGYGAYAAKTRAEAEAEAKQYLFDVPELMHNLNILIDETEEKIRRTDHQMKFLKDQTAMLENEKEQIILTLEKENEQQSKMEALCKLIDGFAECSARRELTLEKCCELFNILHNQFFDEYRLYKLDEIAVASVLPLIRDHFSLWDPLDSAQADYGYALMAGWKKTLETEDRSIFSAKNDLGDLPPYELLLWNGWMPAVRKAALQWSPRDNGAVMLKVVERWLPLLPLWMRENLLEQVVIPRIAAQIEEWNPLVDRIPIHSWFHPWLDVMGDRLQLVFSTIRQKLAKALREWNPTDRSALLMLKPWKECFSSSTMSNFIAMNITPKLEKALREMVYDPTKNIRYDEYYATLEWMDLLGPGGVAMILARSFFPKWQETLRTWLDSPQVKLKEVGMWYHEWRTRIPHEVSSLVPVQEQLSRALIAMRNASEGIPPSHQPPPPPPMEATPVMLTPPPPPRAPPPPPQQTFKEMVEFRAREAGIIFMPQVNKHKEGKQIYYFGSTSIYIDRDVIYAFSVERQQWLPIGLEHLLSIC